MKECATCKEQFPEESFPAIKNRKDKHYRRSSCRSCESKARAGRKFSPPSEQSELRRKKRRTNPIFRPKFIVQDSRKVDKRKGRKNDLTEQLVRELIDMGCFYCLRKSSRMTLDRIDNTIGHVSTNVLPCCWRCNSIRTNMPYEAW